MIFSQEKESSGERTSKMFRTHRKKKKKSGLGLLWVKVWKVAVYLLCFVV